MVRIECCRDREQTRFSFKAVLAIGRRDKGWSFFFSQGRVVCAFSIVGDVLQRKQGPLTLIQQKGFMLFNSRGENLCCLENVQLYGGRSCCFAMGAVYFGKKQPFRYQAQANITPYALHNPPPIPWTVSRLSSFRPLHEWKVSLSVLCNSNHQPATFPPVSSLST